MKREEIKNILGESATDEVVTKLLDALHAEIEPHKTAAKTAQDALAAKVAEIDELSKKTTDADELKKQLNDLKAKYDAETKEAAEKLAQIEFDGAVKDVLTKHGARSEKAVRAMLDLDTLKKSNNRNDDIEKAVTALKESDAYLFGEDGPKSTGQKVTIGAPIQQSGGDTKDVADAIKSQLFGG